ncbi:MAG: hypothetical protein RMK29_09285 [Myxococcales bacterium]|nr:hypothetical protein [Myxococcota bacterium]MDW8281892.1 hypothetical protein [Myxococcales bacterium]
MPTAAHLIYIPVLLMIGIVIGYVLGARAARDAMAAEQRRRQARAARQARQDPEATSEADRAGPAIG